MKTIKAIFKRYIFKISLMLYIKIIEIQSNIEYF